MTGVRCYVSDRLMNRGFGLCFVPRDIFVITFSVRNLTTPERGIGTGRVVYRVKILYGGREMGKKVIADAPRSPFLLY